MRRKVFLRWTIALIHCRHFVPKFGDQAEAQEPLKIGAIST